MQVSILQEKLVKGMSFVSKVVPSKPTLPVLSNVLLVAKGGELHLEATDLSLGVRLKIGAKIKKEGSITVPAKVFGELISSFPPSRVNIELKGESLNISCAGNKVRLSGMDASEFPTLGKVESKSGFVIDTKLFREVVEKVVFAASTDETRPVLSGVLWKLEDKDIVLVATDGYRLSVANLGVSEGKSNAGAKWQKDVQKVISEGIIIPARALREVERLTDEFKASKVRVNLIKGQGLAVFSFSEGEITTRLIEGSFPNYSQVVPKEENTVVEFDLEVLSKSVKTAAIFARESANIIHWKIEKDGVVVSANSPSYGESESSVEAVVKGEGGVIAFNSRYLLDLFSMFSAKRISFSMKGSLDPGVFKPCKKQEREFFHLIMPVRVQK